MPVYRVAVIQHIRRANVPPRVLVVRGTVEDIAPRVAVLLIDRRAIARRSVHRAVRRVVLVGTVCGALVGEAGIAVRHSAMVRAAVR